MECLFWTWAAGVAVFSLRALGGFVVLQRLLRERREPFGYELRTMCTNLQRRLGLERTVEYFHSQLVDAPAVVGWFRPVILVPVSAMAGLTTDQLEAVLLHELAHVQRWDCFVNLFQIVLETALFYHPGVWWVSRLVRNERENCCDDVAVALCGDPAVYARALTSLEHARQTPALLLAANAGSLKSRVSRVLGVDVIARSVPQNGIAVFACVCLVGALLSVQLVGEALFPRQSNEQIATLQVQPPAAVTSTVPAPAVQLPMHSASTSPSPAIACTRVQRNVSRSVVLVRAAENEEIAAAPAPPAPPAPGAFQDDQDVVPPSPPPPPANPKESNGSSYIRDLRSAGFNDLTADNLIALKIQGVTPEYIRQMKAAGFNGPVGELMAMKVQGVSPDYIRRVRAAGFKDASLGEILAMKVQGVDPAQAAEFRRDFGFTDLSMGHIFAFKVQGITPDYVRGLRSAGLKDLSPGEIIAAKVQGITPEFIEKVRTQGLKNLTIHQLLGLKVAGVF
jgi:beta-lactamase regulating signal transducer with metallopeptidase domain